MGADVVVLGNHKLDVTNIHNVANFFAHKLNINIEYGYYYAEYLNIMGLDNTEETFISLGKIELLKGEPFWILSDQMHQAKLAYEKIGDKVFNYDIFWSDYTNNVDPLPDLTMKKRLLKGDYFLESYVPNDNFGFIDIFDEWYSSDLVAFDPRWNAFQAFLLEDEYYKKNKQYLIDYRIENKKVADLLGSEKLYYVSDQAYDLPGFGMHGESGYSWDEIETIILKTGGGEVYNLSELFTNREKYLKYMTKFSYYPNFFVDDFADLK